MAFQYNESTGGSTSQSGTLPWYNDYVQNLLARGQNLQAPAAHTGQRVAGFTPDQQRAFQMASQQAGSWQPQLTQAGSTLGAAGQTFQDLRNSPYTQGALGAYGAAASQAQFDPTAQQQFMNPYISNVTNEIARLGNENFQNNILSGLNANFAGAGQFGSGRQMSMAADAAAKAQREISGQQGNALYQAQQAAGQQYGDWANRGIGAQQALGQAQMGVNQFLQGLGTSQGQLAGYYGQLGQLGQQLGQADIGNILAMGNQQQAQQQAQLGAQQQQFQEQQMQPWNQLNLWSSLFKVPTPQQSTSTSTTNNWTTNFKKGGLVKMADGGEFDWKVSPEEQDRRDGMRLAVLMQEANEFPNDKNLMYELEQMGVDTSNLVPQMTGSLARGAPDVSPARPAMHSTFDTIINARTNNSDLARRMFDERIKLLERARNLPEFAPVPERSTMGRLGESMLRASAMGPANYGQLIGRAGTSYFDQLANETAENKNRALQRLALEEKIVPDVPSSLAGLGISSRSGMSDQYVFVRGTDGKSYMVNRLDPSQRMEVGSGANMGKIIEAADKYATLATKEGLYKSVEEKEADYDRFKQQYIMDRLGEGAGGTTPEAAPTGTALAVPSARSGASTMIQTPGEKKSEEKIGEETGKQYASLQERGAAASGTLNSLDAMEQALQGYDTGKFTPALTSVAQWFDDAGIKIDKDLGPKEAFTAGIKDLALSLKNAGGENKMPGAMSDADRSFLEKMAPSLSNTPEGNRMIIEIYRRLSKRQIEMAKMARAYKNREGGRGYDDRFLDEAQAYSDANPLFADLRAQTQSGQKSRNVIVDY